MDPQTDDEPTCGKGIALGAVLPERLSAVMRGISDVMGNHIRSLDPKETNGQLEIEAYQRLVADHRALGDRLDALAAQMRGYRNLPTAAHDMAALMDKTSFDALAALVDQERDLLAVVQDRVREYGDMLEAMRQA